MSKTWTGTVGFVSLGCQKNLVDSETMLGRLAEEGFVLTSDHEHADVVVINTCGFLEASRDESLDTIKDMVRRKADGDIQRVVVAGCMVGKHQELLLNEVPQVDALISVNDRESLSGLLNELGTSNQIKQHISDPDQRGSVYDDRGRLRLTPRHYAYLRISEGCDHTCSFCIIPQIRGKHRSKSPERILEEARELVADGAKELIIIAQDSTYYGLDLFGEKRLASLLRMLSEELDELEWIRVMYAYPNQVTEELVDTMAHSPKILPYMDMPLQHISSDVLKSMRRGGSRTLIENWITRFRDAMPDFCLRSTFIAGFPGETEEQHKELVEWISQGWVDRVGCFAYSYEPESHSASLKGQLAEPTKIKRQRAVMEAAQKALFASHEKLVGTHAHVIVDGPSQDERYPYVGRRYCDAPEIDCQVYLSSDQELESGAMVEATLTKSLGYDLVAQANKSTP